MTRILLRDLQPGTQYGIQVRATDGMTYSEWSRLFDLSTVADVIPPEQPVWDTNAFVVNGDTFVATWLPLDAEVEQNKDFSHFLLKLSNGSTSVTIKTTNTSYTLTFEQNRVFFGSPSPVLDAQVRSVDAVGNMSAWNELKSATNPPPSAPVNISTTALYDSIQLKWSPVSDVDLFLYRLQVSTTSASTGFSTIYEGVGTDFIHSTTMFTTNHWYRVYAVDKFNSVSTATVSGSVKPKSAFTVDTTPPANATGLAGTGGFDAVSGKAYIDLTWTASATPEDVNQYRVRYSRDGIVWQYEIVPNDTTSLRIDDLIPDASYTVQISAVDATGNASSWSSINKIAGKDTVTPSKPAVPTIATSAMRAQVTISGNKAAGGAMESNVSHYNVYASTSSSFTPGTANMLGRIDVGPAMVETFNIPVNASSGTSQSWYFKIIAVSRSGLLSPSSDSTVASSVALINTASIGDAQITTAKINSLEANKITAGTGIINDLLIKSTLTLGDATTPGNIRSRKYLDSSGAEGFLLTNDNLIIKTGQIHAASLMINNSPNIIPAIYADFAAERTTYSNKVAVDIGGILQGVNPVGGKFGPQRFSGLWGGQASGVRVWFGTSASDYNVRVEAGKTYIFSFYVWSPNQNMVSSIAVKWSNGTVTNLDSKPLLNGNDNPETATRYSGVLTVPAGVTGALVGWQTTTTGDGSMSLDGIMVEEKTGASNEPSTFKVPSTTTIDGGQIRTGSIMSTAAAYDDLGQPITGIRAWQINTNGQAVFGDVLIRGRMIMGVSGESNTSVMKSYGYVPEASGWAVKSNGSAEFNDIYIRAAGEIVGDLLVSGGKIATGPDTEFPRLEINDLGMVGYSEHRQQRWSVVLGTWPDWKYSIQPGATRAIVNNRLREIHTPDDYPWASRFQIGNGVMPIEYWGDDRIFNTFEDQTLIPWYSHGTSSDKGQYIIESAWWAPNMRYWNDGPTRSDISVPLSGDIVTRAITYGIGDANQRIVYLDVGDHSDTPGHVPGRIKTFNGTALESTIPVDSGAIDFTIDEGNLSTSTRPSLYVLSTNTPGLDEGSRSYKTYDGTSTTLRKYSPTGTVTWTKTFAKNYTAITRDRLTGDILMTALDGDHGLFTRINPSNGNTISSFTYQSDRLPIFMTYEASAGGNPDAGYDPKPDAGFNVYEADTADWRYFVSSYSKGSQETVSVRGGEVGLPSLDASRVTGNLADFIVMDAGRLRAGRVEADEIETLHFKVNEDGTGSWEYMMPTGSIMMYGGQMEPDGWMFCDGRTLDRSQYEHLFYIIGTAYGAPSSTTFSLPNFNSRYPRGNANNTGGGSNSKTLVQANIPPHAHSFTFSYNTLGRQNGTGTALAYATAGDGGDVVRTGTTSSAGSGSAFNVEPAYTSVRFIIKVGQDKQFRL